MNVLQTFDDIERLNAVVGYIAKLKLERDIAVDALKQIRELDEGPPLTSRMIHTALQQLIRVNR